MMDATTKLLAVLCVLTLLLCGCHSNNGRDFVDRTAAPAVKTINMQPSISATTTLKTTTTETVTKTTTERTVQETMSLPTTKATTKEQATTAKSTTTAKVTTAATSALPSETVSISNSGVMVSAEYVSQVGFPTGCESASATMLLRFWGVDMTMPTFVDTYLDKGAIRYTKSGVVAPHPDDKFVGDPRSSAAYGCYAPVIVRALNKCLPDELQVVNETGTTLAQLCADYLDNGLPIMVWATIGMSPSRKTSTWSTEGRGDKYTWTAGEHCLLLVGYDQSNYYLLDPYKSRGLVSYPHATVEARYAELGYQAVGIQKILPTTTTTITEAPAVPTSAATEITTTTTECTTVVSTAATTSEMLVSSASSSTTDTTTPITETTTLQTVPELSN